MSVLSAQSIRRQCSRKISPMIDPFVERGVINGVSFGLSACSYDCRSAQEITLPVGKTVLSSTLERFCLPANVCGSVLDKSTHARRGISAMNTHLDPGWEGWLTVELINLGSEQFYIPAGAPLCQIKFEWLDEKTFLPYLGKYQNQENRPVAPIFEKSE
jgi:dCTP deaminase